MDLYQGPDDEDPMSAGEAMNEALLNIASMLEHFLPQELAQQLLNPMQFWNRVTELLEDEENPYKEQLKLAALEICKESVTVVPNLYGGVERIMSFVMSMCNSEETDEVKISAGEFILMILQKADEDDEPEDPDEAEDAKIVMEAEENREKFFKKVVPFCVKGMGLSEGQRESFEALLKFEGKQKHTEEDKKAWEGGQKAATEVDVLCQLAKLKDLRSKLKEAGASTIYDLHAILNNTAMTQWGELRASLKKGHIKRLERSLKEFIKDLQAKEANVEEKRFEIYLPLREPEDLQSCHQSVIEGMLETLSTASKNYVWDLLASEIVPILLKHKELQDGDEGQIALSDAMHIATFFLTYHGKQKLGAVETIKPFLDACLHLADSTNFFMKKYACRGLGIFGELPIDIKAKDGVMKIVTKLMSDPNGLIREEVNMAVASMLRNMDDDDDLKKLGEKFLPEVVSKAIFSIDRYANAVETDVFAPLSTAIEEHASILDEAGILEARLLPLTIERMNTLDSEDSELDETFDILGAMMKQLKSRFLPHAKPLMLRTIQITKELLAKNTQPRLESRDEDSDEDREEEEEDRIEKISMLQKGSLGFLGAMVDWSAQVTRQINGDDDGKRKGDSKKSQKMGATEIATKEFLESDDAKKILSGYKKGQHQQLLWFLIDSGPIFRVARQGMSLRLDSEALEYALSLVGDIARCCFEIDTFEEELKMFLNMAVDMVELLEDKRSRTNSIWMIGMVARAMGKTSIGEKIPSLIRLLKPFLNPKFFNSGKEKRFDKDKDLEKGASSSIPNNAAIALGCVAGVAPDVVSLSEGLLASFLKEWSDHWSTHFKLRAAESDGKTKKKARYTGTEREECALSFSGMCNTVLLHKNNLSSDCLARFADAMRNFPEPTEELKKLFDKCKAVCNDKD